MSALCGVIQQGIESLYRIDRSLPASDFWIDDKVLDQVKNQFQGASVRRESLVVCAQDGHTELLLYIGDEVMAKAARFSSGLPTWPANDLDAFCAAVEGISHFVYFVFCGERQERSVSELELELQAEIDKYLLLRVCLDVPGQTLLFELFSRFELPSDLSEEQSQRYQVANRLGKRYARWLDRKFAAGQGGAALDHARHLYRKPLAAKLDGIARLAAR